MDDDFSGLTDLENDLAKLADAASDSRVHTALTAGASEFVTDLRKLPYPISDIRKPGYTHMVEKFTYADDTRSKSPQVLAGWGKYYGRMVEHGTKLMRAQPHLEPLYSKGKKRYEATMVKALNI